MPNPIVGLLRSRKFLLALVDAFAAILALWIGAYVPEQTAVLILATWAAIQPVFIVVIGAIAYEDKANVAASAAVEEAEIYHKATLAKIEAERATDEHLAALTEAYEKGLADGKAT